MFHCCMRAAEVPCSERSSRDWLQEAVYPRTASLGAAEGADSSYWTAVGWASSVRQLPVQFGGSATHAGTQAVGSAGSCRQVKAGGDWCSALVVLEPLPACCSCRLPELVVHSPDSRGKTQQDSVMDRLCKSLQRRSVTRNRCWTF